MVWVAESRVVTVSMKLSQTAIRSEYSVSFETFSKSRKVLSLIFRLAKASFVVPSSFFDDGISLSMSSSKWMRVAK